MNNDYWIVFPNRTTQQLLDESAGVRQQKSVLEISTRGSIFTS